MVGDIVLRDVPMDVLVCGTMELVVGPLDGSLETEGPFAPIIAAAAPFAVFAGGGDAAVAVVEGHTTVCRLDQCTCLDSSVRMS